MASNMRTNEQASSQCTPGCCNLPCFKEDVVARLRAKMPADDDLEEARVLFAALGDKTRLKLLHAPRGGEELCVCVSAASHHLRKLRDLRILKYRNDGKMAYYSLRNPVVRKLLDRALRAA